MQILHVVEKQEWNTTLIKGFYAPKSLKTDKFIHCSTKNQVVDVANFNIAFKKRVKFIKQIIENAFYSKLVFHSKCLRCFF